jgi:hypothetical protein
MERRLLKRVTHNLKAEYISGGMSYTGFIENFSEDGIFMRTAPTKTAIDFSSQTNSELKFQLSSGETFHIHGEVRWFHTEISSHGLIFRIGVKITNPSSQYIKFLKTL